MNARVGRAHTLRLKLNERNGEKVRANFGDYLDSKGDDGALEISAIADAFFMLHEQHRTAWTQELDLRPFKEEF